MGTCAGHKNGDSEALRCAVKDSFKSEHCLCQVEFGLLVSGEVEEVTTEVVIVGAGPYGLSVAAHLETQRVSFRIIGVPMEFWRNSMPQGMSLKSDGWASSIYDPARSLSLQKYCADENLPYSDLGLPVTLASFISYGLAFQKRMVPAVEQCGVTSISIEDGLFLIRLDSGETFVTRKVVLAVGVGYFAYVPEVIAELPPNLATHSSQHSDLNSFANRDVAIVGAGSSALDLAALLRDVGARPVVIARTSCLKFHDRQRLPRTLMDRLRAPSSGIGPGWRSKFFCSAPIVFHFMPQRWRLFQTKRHAGPSGGWFIKDQVMNKVPIFVNSKVETSSVEGDGVVLRITDGETSPKQVSVDHVIAATGYRVAVDRLSFLDESLRSLIRTVQSTPILNSHFESSVPGLYFVGPAAANSFGPPQRFAVGAQFAARQVARSLKREN